MTVAEALPTIGASIRDIDNWMSRLELRSEFAPSRRGRARVFSRENTLELALIAALVKAGISPRKASELAWECIEAERIDVRIAWAAFAGDGKRNGLFGSPLTTSILEHILGKENIVLTLVHLEKIFREVDQLFFSEEEQGPNRKLQENLDGA